MQQFHLGALRNNNARLLRTLGPDTGFDSIGDFEIARSLSRFLDRLDDTNQLAKTILYNLNPRDNELIGIDDRQLPGRLGPGQDAVRVGLVVPRPGRRHDEADERAVEPRPAVAVRGHGHRLAQLPVVLAPRVLPPPALQPAWARTSGEGLLPDDRALLGRLVENVCFFNARDYFGFPMGAAADVDRAGERQ